MRDDANRLKDILEAIDKAEAHTGGGHAESQTNELLQVRAVHHLQIIGEAASKLSADLRTAHPEVPWSRIIGTRNVLIHDYVAVDIDIVWTAVERDLPELRVQIQAILKAS